MKDKVFCFCGEFRRRVLDGNFCRPFLLFSEPFDTKSLPGGGEPITLQWPHLEIKDNEGVSAGKCLYKVYKGVRRPLELPVCLPTPGSILVSTTETSYRGVPHTSRSETETSTRPRDGDWRLLGSRGVRYSFRVWTVWRPRKTFSLQNFIRIYSLYKKKCCTESVEYLIRRHFEIILTNLLLLKISYLKNHWICWQLGFSGMKKMGSWVTSFIKFLSLLKRLGYNLRQKLLTPEYKEVLRYTIKLVAL